MKKVARRSAALALFLSLASLASFAFAQQYVVKPITEKKIAQLPPGQLVWRIETLPTLEQAKAAEGPTSLVAQVDGKTWLFTLGAPGGATPGAARITEIGPVPALTAPEYLLRVNLGSGPPGSKTAIHTHPGSESFYVLAGRLGQRTPQGEQTVEAGQILNGKGADVPMEVFNAGPTDVQAVVLFVVDATRPFSSHASIK